LLAGVYSIPLIVILSVMAIVPFLLNLLKSEPSSLAFQQVLGGVF
jgi:hypothetical protein